MKARRCWRYKCDFCKKSGCCKSAITDHEKCCFGNPNRRCKMCEAQWPRPELIAILAGGVTAENEAEKVKALEEAAEYCPACVVTTMRQAPMPKETVPCYQAGDDIDPTGTTEVSYYFAYDYKTKSREYMDEKRSEENSCYGL